MNPRYPSGYSGFQDHRHRPLGHPSAFEKLAGVAQFERSRFFDRNARYAALVFLAQSRDLPMGQLLQANAVSLHVSPGRDTMQPLTA